MRPSQLSRRTFVATLCAAALPSSLDARAASAIPIADLATLEKHLATIARVRVFSLSGDIETIVALSPAALESFAGVRKRSLTKSADIRKLVDAFRHAGPTTNANPFDARFGAVFEDRAGFRRFAAYTNATASHGTIGSRAVAFNDPPTLLGALERASR